MIASIKHICQMVKLYLYRLTWEIITIINIDIAYTRQYVKCIRFFISHDPHNYFIRRVESYLLAKYSVLLQIAKFSNMDLFMQASGL